MRKPAVRWCCDHFLRTSRQQFETEPIGDGLFSDRRGFFVDYKPDPSVPMFVLVCRSVDRENFGKFVAAVPISLESELAIQFCPWCGKNLARFYRNHLEQLCPSR